MYENPQSSGVWECWSASINVLTGEETQALQLEREQEGKPTMWAKLKKRGGWGGGKREREKGLLSGQHLGW